MNILKKEKRKRALWTGTSIASVGFITGTFAETVLGTVTTSESIVSRLGFTSLGYAVGDDYFEGEEKAQEKYLSKGNNSSFGKKEAFKAVGRFGFTTTLATTIYSLAGQEVTEALSNGAILGGQGVAVAPFVERTRDTMLMLQDYELPGKKAYEWIKNSSEKAKKVATCAIIGSSIAGMLTMYTAKNKIYPEQRGIEYFMDKAQQDTQYKSIDDVFDK